MCGIAGIIDLRGRRHPDAVTLERMANALWHRGPDEDGYLFRPGFGFASRRLSIVGLGDGRQPIFNEDQTVAVVYNGELFDYRERKAELQAKGHVFRTHTDTELIVHLYEEYGEDVFTQLKGQFAVALIDFKKRTIFLGRDRVGICPLHWARQGDWVYFGSEIKAVIASGDVPVGIDPRGLDHIFTFFAMGTRRTMFDGVQSILPGHYLKIAFRSDGKPTDIVERRYWDFDFPDAGDEEDEPYGSERLVDEFEAAFSRAVELRLRADVPVVSYLSGGVDSAYVLASATRLRGGSVPSFTIQVPGKGFDETQHALVTARHVNSLPTILTSDAKVISDTYAKLVASADCPVPDTSCASLWCLSQEVHHQGYKVALTGEGSDEGFGGYIWFKLRQLSYWMDFGGFHGSDHLNRAVRRMMAPYASISEMKRIDDLSGRAHAQALLYHLVGQAGHRYFSADLKDRIGSHVPYEDLPLDRERMRRWSPLNQSLYFGYKIHLAGQLLNYKGDRVAMANSVETRYPFLDEDVIAFLSRVSPRWKLRGLRDKYLLRRAAARLLPDEVAFRPKGMFRAPLAESFLVNPPPFVRQLMSQEALRKTGYFDPETVARDAALITSGKANKVNVFNKLGLSSVIATQLWHHLYLGGGLCELSDQRPQPPVERPTLPPAAA